MASWLAAACSPDAQHGIGGIDEFPAADGGLTADATLGLEPLAFAVVSTDYTATSISLLHPDGSLLAEHFVHSGSAPAGLVTALSGDVVLPTRSGDPGVLTIIDRFRTDVITRIDPQTGSVLGQVKTHPPNTDSSAASFSSNPQDFVFIDADSAWVSRFEPNLAVASDHPDRGNDLLHIDPSHMQRTGRRIDLSSLDGRGLRGHGRSDEEVTVYARPSGMLRLGDYLVVGLARLSRTFDASDEGMVALVDVERERVEGLRIPELRGCTSLAPVPDDATRVAVGCSGLWAGGQRATAGVAMLRLEGDRLELEYVWRGQDHPEAALSAHGLIPLSDHEVLAVAVGEPETRDAQGRVLTPSSNDRLYLLDLRTGEQQLVLEATGRFKLGGGVYNPRRQLALVPDASVDAAGRPVAGVHRLRRRDTNGMERLDTLPMHAILPARSVRPL